MGVDLGALLVFEHTSKPCGFVKHVKIQVLSGGLVSCPYHLRFGFGGDLFLSILSSLCSLLCCISRCPSSVFFWSANMKDLGRVAVCLALGVYIDLSSE